MKKGVIIVAVCLLLGLALSACNNEVCPAYSHADTEQPAEAV